MVQSVKIIWARSSSTKLIIAGVCIAVVFGALILGVARNPSIKGQLFSYSIMGNMLQLFMVLSLYLILLYINRDSVMIGVYYYYYNVRNYFGSIDFIGLLITSSVFLVILGCAYINTDYIYCMDELTKNLEFAEKDYEVAYNRWHATCIEYRYPDYDIKNLTPELEARRKFIKSMIPRFDEAQADAEVRRIWAKWDIEEFQKKAAESSNSTTNATNASSSTNNTTNASSTNNTNVTSSKK